MNRRERRNLQLKIRKEAKKEAKKNNNLHTQVSGYQYVPPSNLSEYLCRGTIDGLRKNIKVPHCMICLDTEEDGGLVDVVTTRGLLTVCNTYLGKICINYYSPLRLGILLR